MNTQDYLNFARYKSQPASSVAGFSAFQDAGTGLYYFSMLDEDDGSVLLISEGYTTEAARDNGINSVINNRDIDERYHLTATGDGHYYLSLKAANHQEIARTDTFGSAALARAMLPSERKKAKAAMAAAAVAATAATKPVSEKRNTDDDYLPCSAYEGHPRSAFNDFTTFEAKGKYYFAMVDSNGRVVLRSEGYQSIAARDSGIQSVIANRDIKERYTTKELSSGSRVKILTAANHQEIARSCPIKDEPIAVPMSEPVVEPSKFNWWWLLLPLLLLGFLAWRSCNKKPEVIAPPAVDTTRVDTVKAMPPIEEKMDTARMDTMKKVSSISGDKIHPIFFDFDKSDLTAESTAELDKLVADLKAHPGYTTKLKAFADEKGSDQYNVALSRRRALAAKNYVVDHGINSRNVSISTFGEKKPVAKNHLENGADTEEGRHYNRRVEIEVLNHGVNTHDAEPADVPTSLKS